MKISEKGQLKSSNSLQNIITTLQTPSRLRTLSEISELMNLTASSEFFARITKSHQSTDFQRLACMHMTLEEFSKGSPIFQFGDLETSLFIVLHGSATITLPEKLKNITNIPKEFQHMINKLVKSASIKTPAETMEKEEQSIKKLFMDLLEKDQRTIEDIANCKNRDITEVLSVPESFGYAGLFTDRLKSYNITANEKLYLGVISRTNFKKIIAGYLEKKNTDRVDFLHKLPLFTTWSRISLSKLLESFTPATYVRNQKIFAEGDPANFLIFIISGELKLTKAQIITKNIINLQDLNQDSVVTPLRIGKVRKISKSNQLQLVVKGKNQIIGIEDMSENKKQRAYSCYCYSSRADVLILSQQVFLDRIYRPENFGYINNKVLLENSWLNDRINEIKKVDIGFSIKKAPSKSVANKKPSLRLKTDTPVFFYKTLNEKPRERPSSSLNTTKKRRFSLDLRPNTNHSPKKSELKRLPPPNFLTNYRKKSESLSAESYQIHHTRHKSS